SKGESRWPDPGSPGGAEGVRNTWTQALDFRSESCAGLLIRLLGGQGKLKLQFGRGALGAEDQVVDEAHGTEPCGHERHRSRDYLCDRFKSGRVHNGGVVELDAWLRIERLTH